MESHRQLPEVCTLFIGSEISSSSEIESKGNKVYSALPERCVNIPSLIKGARLVEG
jgi:hypothetical protein